VQKDIFADMIVVGAGVVGCAIARELSRVFPHKKIIVLEKLAGAGLETSSKNSGVLHSGLHQNSKFLKSRLCQEGLEVAVEYLNRNQLPGIHCGMIIASSGNIWSGGLYKDWKSLGHLLKNAYRQDIQLKFLLSRAIKKIEPNIKASCGIFIPHVWIIDPIAFTQKLYTDAQNQGVEFFFENPVREVHMPRCSRIYEVITPKKCYFANTIINAAGLYADEIAAMGGFPHYKIFPWRGEYYEVVSEKKNLVNRLIYPVVPPGYPGKGIHFSPRVDGKLFIGPNARPVPRKNYYTEDKTPVEVFLKSAQKFLPDIEDGDLRWAYSGIRPKLTNDPIENDFIISFDRASPPFINLIGIESPGLTSSMAIAKYVANMLKNVL